MVKRIAIITLLLLAGLVTLFVYINRGHRNLLTDPFRMVPADAPFIVETGNLPGLLNAISENNQLFNELIKTAGLEKFAAGFNALRSFLNRPEVVCITENRRALLSFHFNHDGKLTPLLNMTLPPDVGFREVGALFRPEKGFTVTRPGNSRRKIKICMSGAGAADTIFLAWSPGMVTCSTSPDMLALAEETAAGKMNIRESHILDRLISTAGKEGERIYLIFPNMAGLSEKITGKAENNPGKLISRINGTACFDIFINDQGYVFSGYAHTSDSSRILPGNYSHPDLNLSTYGYLPAGVSMFETIVTEGEPVYKDSLMNQENPAAMLAAKLKPFAGTEFTRARLSVEDKKDSKATVFIWSVRNKDAAERTVTGEFDNWIGRYNLKEKDFISWFEPDDQIKIPVFSTPFAGLTGRLSGISRMLTADSVIAFSDDFMITSDSREAVMRVLYENMLHRTIINDAEFRDFESTLPSRAGYFSWFVPASNTDILNGMLSDTLVRKFNDTSGSLKKITCAGFRFVPSNEMIYGTLSVRFMENISENTGTEWETKLDGMVTGRPFFFVNHNTGAREIVVQDDKNNLYLINAAGRILWKVSVNEAVNGSFFMIDYYRNGKNQIFFAGRDYLHLIDRNGNYVERFPVRLRASASGPATLYDYDNNLDYRIFVPGSDKLIYLYDKTGNVVKGWKPFRTQNPVRTGVKYFRVSGKDYIVVTDGGSMNILDRTGNIRVKTSGNVLTAAGTEIRLATGVPPSIVCSAPDGTVQFISFDGKISTTVLGDFTTSHVFDYFDLDGDGYGEFLFIDKGKLYLYDHDRSGMFVRDLGSESIEGPWPFIFSSTERMAGLFNSQARQILLIDSKGNDTGGSPFKGFSAFIIGRLTAGGSFNLITGGNDNFLYNYKLITIGNK